MERRSSAAGDLWQQLRGRVEVLAVLFAAMWIIFALDRFLPLERYGLLPRTVRGLVGILAMPFLHADLSHIMSNSAPLVVLLLILAATRPRPFTALFCTLLAGGTLLWLGGRTALHIGASGLVFGLVTYLMVAGWRDGRVLPWLAAIAVGIAYGGMLWSGVLPWQVGHGVSWDGHLAGAIGGAAVGGYERRCVT